MTNAIAVPGFVQRGLPWGIAALLFILLLLGGGPPRLLRLLLESLALGGVLTLLWLQLFYRPIRSEARLPGLFMLLILLIPAVQLIPLPYDLWSGLPGREFTTQVYQTAGLGAIWRPLSLDPEATRDTALTLLAPLALLFGTYALPPRQRLWLAYPVIAVGTLSALMGVAQLAMPAERGLYVTAEAIVGQPSGLFSNRNHQCDLLLIAMMLTAWVMRAARRKTVDKGEAKGLQLWHFGLLLIAFLAVMTIATQSRFGVLMTGPLLLLCIGLIFAGGMRREVPLAIGGLLLAFGALLLFAPGLWEAIGERFGSESENRIESLPDMLYAAELYMPAGSGVGTFVPVYKAAESLALVDPSYLNHAHNDYLEILIETGIVGVLMVILFLIAFAIRAWRIARAGGDSPYLWLQRVAAVAIALLLVHSTVDYPLRSIGLEALFAFLCAILFSKTPPPERRRRRSE